MKGCICCAKGNDLPDGEMTDCQARPDRYGVMRCVACRVTWDADDVPACPRQAPPVVPLETPLHVFVSALAPDNLAANIR